MRRFKLFHIKLKLFIWVNCVENHKRFFYLHKKFPKGIFSWSLIPRNVKRETIIKKTIVNIIGVLGGKKKSTFGKSTFSTV